MQETKGQLVINKITTAQASSMTLTDKQLWLSPDTAVYSVNNTQPDANGNVSLSIPTVNNATLTIQRNGTTVNTFTANASSDVTANITVPTNTNQLTNGAGYITSSALSGYATETWVGQQGYITGITSSDVTTALGYTPYSSSNPNGYTSNVGTVTSVNNVSPVSGNVTLSIPTVNNPTITITQGGVTKGSFTLNQASGDTIALDAGGGGGGSYTAGTGIDITGSTISVASPTLTNTATGTNSLTLLGTASTAVQAVNIGVGSSTIRNGVAIGYNAKNTGSYNVSIGYGSSCSVNLGYSVALGGEAKTTAKYAIQIGYGTNSEANSVYMSTSQSNNWKMLGNDGYIPIQRIDLTQITGYDASVAQTLKHAANGTIQWVND